MKTILLLVLLGFSQAQLFRKNLAGPPSEFGSNLIPQPNVAALEEKSATLEMFFEIDQTTPQQLVWKQVLPVDSDTAFSFNVFSLMADYFQYQMVDPSGNSVDVLKYMGDGTMIWGEQEFIGTNFFFRNFPVGLYELTITVPLAARKLTVADQPDGVFVLFNDSPVKIQTHLNTYKLRLGGEIGLVTKLTDDGVTAMKDSIISATMIVRDPSGKEEEVAMHDDGLHSDGDAKDGVYGGYMTAEKTGTFSAEALILGQDGNGRSIIRSSQHLIPIVEEKMKVHKKGFAIDNDDLITIFVKAETTAEQQNYRAYAEVWGKNEKGDDISVAWIGGMVQVEKFREKSVIALQLNKQWMTMAGASGPLTLRNFYVQDSSTWVPIVDYTDIIVKHSENYKFKRDMTVSITDEMRQGKKPKEFIEHMNSTAKDLAPNLIMIHGYCSGSNPWPTNQFTNAAYFLQASVSVTCDAFAIALNNFANQNGMTRFGSIGHSQGGMAQVHLFNYYWSGYDNAVGAKLLQSVGTPYLGNSAAGSAANVGKVFGVGCGPNTDLSTDGAVLWNVGIANFARRQVSYYTTTYKLGQTFGDWCNLAIQLILDYPNDGTAEMIRTNLVNATNMGSKQQWCHVGGMKYTAQYLDSARNSIMNSQAAR